MSCPEAVLPEGGEVGVRPKGGEVVVWPEGREAGVWPEGGEVVLPNSGGGGGGGVEGGEGVDLPLSLAPRLCKKAKVPCSPSEHKA